MNKIQWVIIGVLLVANKAQANPLQITEARTELGRLVLSRSEAKKTLSKAQAAYSALNKAESRQKKALALLIKADQAKQMAQRNSIDSVANGKEAEAYYADNGAATGTAMLIEKPRYLEEAPYLQGS